METETNYTGGTADTAENPREIPGATPVTATDTAAVTATVAATATSEDVQGSENDTVASNGKCDGSVQTESDKTKICDIAGVCTIKFNSQELHRKYFEAVKNFLEHLLRESAEDLSQLFCVDTTRTENSVPLKQFYTSINNSSLLEDAAESSSKGGGKNCFNCLGDHHINECPNPIDRKAVAENRRKLQSKQIGSNTRFFEDEDRNVRFTPGKWSRRLLEAMGVRSNEVPPFVYRMRVLGYPPGWLCEAEETSSGIKLFDGSGNEVQDMSGDEDGLVDDEPPVRYNPEKLITVPGFNVDLLPGMVDDSWRMGMPPIQPHQSIATAIASMSQGREAKPRKLKLPPPKNSSPADEPAKSKVSPLKRPMDPVNGDDANNTGPSGAKLCKIDEEHEGGLKSPTTSSAPPLVAVAGTPIPQSISRVDSLPSAEKWSQGVAEHIPYENLPGATGTFEKMRGLLLKIKDLKKAD